MKFPFDKVMDLLIEYKKEHKNLFVPARYCTPDGIRLGNLVHHIRTGMKKITPEEKERLTELGFVWNCHIPMDKVIELLKEYKETHGDLLVPARYSTAAGIKLGGIVRSIRAGLRETTWKEKAMLNQLGFVWKVRRVKR